MTSEDALFSLEHNCNKSDRSNNADMQGCLPFTYILLNLVRYTYMYLLFYLLLLTMVTRNTDIFSTISTHIRSIKPTSMKFRHAYIRTPKQRLVSSQKIHLPYPIAE